LNAESRLPLLNGLGASTLQLPAGSWDTLADYLANHFPHVSREQWLARMALGRVLDSQGQPLDAASAYAPGARIHYYRDVPTEIVIPFAETILYEDAHLLVADKPHFLPVTPVGHYVRETLLARLVTRTGNADLAPLHRIDRGTAGLVLFSVNPATRSTYQALFREHQIVKRYAALAAPLPGIEFPHVRTSRIVRGHPFIRSQEVPGDVNAETRIEVEERGEAVWRYRLYPVSGRKHQLRLHLSALGAPIVNDELYPDMRQRPSDDFSLPLKLLAHGLKFVDPVTREVRSFTSQFELG
jgi:tRNA pseudouridine32 synthase / 23S rRNA pseudouridine746 synthase